MCCPSNPTSFPLGSLGFWGSPSPSSTTETPDNPAATAQNHTGVPPSPTTQYHADNLSPFGAKPCQPSPAPTVRNHTSLRQPQRGDPIPAWGDAPGTPKPQNPTRAESPTSSPFFMLSAANTIPPMTPPSWTDAENTTVVVKTSPTPGAQPNIPAWAKIDWVAASVARPGFESRCVRYQTDSVHGSPATPVADNPHQS